MHRITKINNKIVFFPLVKAALVETNRDLRWRLLVLPIAFVYHYHWLWRSGTYWLAYNGSLLSRSTIFWYGTHTQPSYPDAADL